MPQLMPAPTVVGAAGTKPKLIEEYVGRISTGEARVSVARMRSSTPEPGGAEHVAVCLPAFSPETVHRDG